MYILRLHQSQICNLPRVYWHCAQRKTADWTESSTKLIWNWKEKTTTVFSEDEWHFKHHHSQRVHFLFTVFEILFRQYWTRGLVRARQVFGVAHGVRERWSVVYFALPECWSELSCITVDSWGGQWSVIVTVAVTSRLISYSCVCLPPSQKHIKKYLKKDDY